jgi:hypothetical protein
LRGDTSTAKPTIAKGVGLAFAAYQEKILYPVDELRLSAYAVVTKAKLFALMIQQVWMTRPVRRGAHMANACWNNGLASKKYALSTAPE